MQTEGIYPIKLMAANEISQVCYNHPDKKADFKCFDCKLGKFEPYFLSCISYQLNLAQLLSNVAREWGKIHGNKH